MTERAKMYLKAYYKFKAEAYEMEKDANLARDLDDKKSEAFFEQQQREMMDTASFFFSEYTSEGKKRN
jgi:hypothetical protein